MIGDIVGSRNLPDRARAQRRLLEVLDDVARLVPGVQPLEPTVADEFQGAWAGLADALRATLLVRLTLLPEIDVRCGIGQGEATVFDAERSPMLQDGSAWWAARAAIESLGRPRHAGRRTWWEGPGQPSGRVALVNAHLLCRDALVDRLSERGWRMLGLALRGETQKQIAAAEGISESAVSQQFAGGISAVRDAQRLLESLDRTDDGEEGDGT